MDVRLVAKGQQDAIEEFVALLKADLSVKKVATQVRHKLQTILVIKVQGLLGCETDELALRKAELIALPTGCKVIGLGLLGGYGNHQRETID